MTGNQWNLVPTWNGGNAFRDATLTVGPPRAPDRWLAPALKYATVGVVAVLLLAWLGSIVARYASEPKLLTWTVAASAVLVVMAVSGRGDARLDCFCWAAVAVPVGASARNWRGALMLIGVPWLAFFVVRALPQIGQCPRYSVDDWLAYQVAGYRIFMNGFWLEGGTRSSTISRSIAGSPARCISCSATRVSARSTGMPRACSRAAWSHSRWSRPSAGFRWAVGAAAATLATFTVGTIWYFVGRGLSEIAAAGFAFFAALAILRGGGRLTARRGRRRAGGADVLRAAQPSDLRAVPGRAVAAADVPTQRGGAAAGGRSPRSQACRASTSVTYLRWRRAVRASHVVVHRRVQPALRHEPEEQ